ncbi:MAG: type II toxin-antitoxin system RelE/ParE family toxin [Dehalococcoidia bacterium]|nr:type II toxin-antitoxin system RelE/ParE family toxin [Dehalococcoidia bacterium]
MDPEAEAELEAAVDWHLSHSRDVAERFADEYERVIEAIHRFPEIGRPIDGGLRRLNIGRTDYTIIYRLRMTSPLSSLSPTHPAARDTGASACNRACYRCSRIHGRFGP